MVDEPTVVVKTELPLVTTDTIGMVEMALPLAPAPDPLAPAPAA